MAATKARFLGRLSSMAPEKDKRTEAAVGIEDGIENMSDVIQLLFYSSQGDVAGVESVLAKGVDVNSFDFDKRTALHVAACEGKKEIVELLLARGANVNAQDRWGSTPLADARFYHWDGVSKILEDYGGQSDTSPMRVSRSRDVPDYEVNPAELKFEGEDSCPVAKWRGTKVFLKVIPLDSKSGEDKAKEFVNELSLMLKLRHPNVVQFLGAVTQSVPMMLVTEYLSKGDLQAYLRRKGKPLKPKKALKFAFDIARGVNYVHEFKPEPVIHRNLKPSNLLRDKAGHLKITDFAFTKSVVDYQQFVHTSGRYMAPELSLHQNFDRKVDVFSFALILQEMMEGTCPFSKMGQEEAAKAYAEGARPPFKVKPRYYPEGLKELIEECWHEDPAKRPTFSYVIKKLEAIRMNYTGDSVKTCLTNIRYSKLCGR